MPATVIYSMPQVMQITIDGINAEETFMIASNHYHNSNIKIFRSVTNPIDFLLKNIDRKAVNLTGKTARLVIWKSDNTIVFEKDLDTIAATKGHYKVILSAAESQALPLGDFNWSVVITSSLVETMAFTDQNYTNKATMTILDGIPPVIEPVIELSPDDLTSTGTGYVTYSIPEANFSNSGQHTSVFTLDNFTGDIIFEATLDPEPPTNTEWTVIDTESFSGSTGTINRSYEGNYTFTRFRFSTIVGLTGIEYRN